MKKLCTIILLCLITTTIFSQQQSRTRMPMLGEKAPKFSAKSTNGNLNFPDDYYGKWKILFSHPASFTPVCTSELLELAYLQDDFDKINTALIVLSTDGINSHIEWVKSMESINYMDRGTVDIQYPIVSDVGYEISNKYGMIHPESSTTKDIRAVFIIDPDNRIKAIIYYPLNVGRNIDEILRTMVALQKVDKREVLTPANWNPGDDYLVKSPESIKEAEKLKSKNDSSMYSLAWYMWYKSVN